MKTTNTIPLSPNEQVAEHQLLDRFARFWSSRANEDQCTTYDRFAGQVS